jgi:hypothetical protein
MQLTIYLNQYLSLDQPHFRCSMLQLATFLGSRAVWRTKSKLKPLNLLSCLALP